LPSTSFKKYAPSGATSGRRAWDAVKIFSSQPEMGQVDVLELASGFEEAPPVGGVLSTGRWLEGPDV
jgi:hypothetical protein